MNSQPKRLLVSSSVLCLTGLVLSALALAGPATAQTVDRKKQIRERTKEMRTEMRKGQIRHFNVYVTVRLKNGNRLKGVVKNGQFIELDNGLDFVSADRDDPRAGLRIWFTAGTNSFIFLTYGQIAHYEIGNTLSDQQVKAIEAQIAKKRQEIDEQYKRLAEKKRNAEAAKKGEGSAAGTGREKEGELKLTAEQKALLAEFPPSEGWSAKKLNDLKVRRITLGVFPNEKEKKFESVFAAWVKAVEAQVAMETAKTKQKTAQSTQSTGRTSGGSKRSEPVSSTPPPAPGPVSGGLPPGVQPVPGPGPKR